MIKVLAMRRSPVFCTLLLLSPLTASAGSLDDFDRAATQSPAGKPVSARSDRESDSDNFFDVLLRAIFQGPASRGQVADGVAAAPHQPGDSILPWARLELGGQILHDGIHGIDGRAQAGFQTLGLEVQRIAYHDSHNGESLVFTQLHGLARFAVTGNWEAGIGLGATLIDGRNSGDGLSGLLYSNLLLTPCLALRLRTDWSTVNSNTVASYEGAAEFTNGYYAVDAGFRQLRVGDQRLSGPYMGLVFHY